MTHDREDATHTRVRRFSLVEAITVLTALGILAVLLYPLRAIFRERPRNVTSVSIMHQLATAAMMYVQDHQRYPGLNWHQELESYCGSRECFASPESRIAEQEDSISFAYNGLLLRNDGSGLPAEAIVAPSQLGLFIDAMPTRTWSQGGGVITPHARWAGRRITPVVRKFSFPQNGDDTGYQSGILMSYADGHVQIISTVARTELANPTHAYNKAFIRAKALGYLK